MNNLNLPITSKTSELNRRVAKLLSITESAVDIRSCAYSTIPDELFAQLSELLRDFDEPEAAERPRLYAVLYLIHKEDLIGDFVRQGIFDIALPFNGVQSIPFALKSVPARTAFDEFQYRVLSVASGLEDENGNGEHRNLEDGDLHFERVAHLGSGSFGYVDSVRSRLSQKVYARKRIIKDSTDSLPKEILDAFTRELKTLKGLSHNHLVKFRGSYTDLRYVAIIMSPVAEYNLEVYLKRSPFPVQDYPQLRLFFGCLASGLRYLHYKNIRHKDIKPSNFLITSKGDILITDFGSALDWTEYGRSTTVKGDQLGLTKEYCSPESMIPGVEHNSSSDIFSLGVVYLEMATVLRGNSLPAMGDFFKGGYSRTMVVSTNLQAAGAWIRVLAMKHGDKRDELPLEWIRKMIQYNGNDRPGCDELLDWIYRSAKVPLFCCDNCRHEGIMRRGSSNTGLATSSSVLSYSNSTTTLLSSSQFSASTYIPPLVLSQSLGHGYTPNPSRIMNNPLSYSSSPIPSYLTNTSYVSPIYSPYSGSYAPAPYPSNLYGLSYNSSSQYNINPYSSPLIYSPTLSGYGRGYPIPDISSNRYALASEFRRPGLNSTLNLLPVGRGQQASSAAQFIPSFSLSTNSESLTLPGSQDQLSIRNRPPGSDSHIFIKELIYRTYVELYGSNHKIGSFYGSSTKSSIYVDGLHSSIMETKLFEYFCHFGQIKSIRAGRINSSLYMSATLGFAFVNFEGRTNMDTIIKSVVMHQIDSRPCRIIYLKSGWKGLIKELAPNSIRLLRSIPLPAIIRPQIDGKFCISPKKKHQVDPARNIDDFAVGLEKGKLPSKAIVNKLETKITNLENILAKFDYTPTSKMKDSARNNISFSALPTDESPASNSSKIKDISIKPVNRPAQSLTQMRASSSQNEGQGTSRDLHAKTPARLARSITPSDEAWQEEDEKMLSEMVSANTSWKEIFDKFPNRTKSNVKTHGRRLAGRVTSRSSGR